VISAKSTAIGANPALYSAQTRAQQRPRNPALSANHQAPVSYAVDADEVKA
jgi:hypothetical protein